MYRSVAVIMALSVALTCAAAKSTGPVHVPLPPNNPLRNNEQETADVKASDGSILRKETAKPRQSHGNRLLPARLSSRGDRTAHNGTDLAGDANIS